MSEKPSFLNALSEKIGEGVDINRLKECISYWQELAYPQGWNPENESAVLDLYAPGGLEYRQESKCLKEAKACGFIDEFKLFSGIENVPLPVLGKILARWKKLCSENELGDYLAPDMNDFVSFYWKFLPREDSISNGNTGA
jgi:hypothetical protein